MNVRELLLILSNAPLDARVVLTLPNGDDIDVADVKHHCQLVAVSADIPVDELPDNSAYIEEAMAQFPAEDFLETPTRSIRALKFPPRMDEFKTALIETLEEIQTECAQASEYGREQLRLALAENDPS